MCFVFEEYLFPCHHHVLQYKYEGIVGDQLVLSAVIQLVRVPQHLGHLGQKISLYEICHFL
jgi:hypothetical protein